MTIFPPNPTNGDQISIGDRTWEFNATYGVWDSVDTSEITVTGATFQFVDNGITLNGKTLSINSEVDIVMGGVTFNPGIDIAGGIRHTGDPDTRIAFSTDRVTLEAGGTVYQTIGLNDCTDFNSTEVREAKLKDYSEHVNAIGTVTSNTAVNFESGNVQTVTIGGNCEFSFSNPPASGQAGTVTLIVTNGGAHTTTFASAIKWPGDVAPTLTSSGVDILSFLTIDAGTNVYGFIGGINFS